MPVLALVVLLLLAGGSAVMVKTLDDRSRVRQALRLRAVQSNLDPDYVEVLGGVEGPDWKLDAINMSGPDGARGGAWGPTQITEKTARGAGYTGAMQRFREDPDLAALWTCIILRQAGVTIDSTLADVCAAWNAGKYHADRDHDGTLNELPADHLTRKTYLPRALAVLATVAPGKGAIS